MKRIFQVTTLAFSGALFLSACTPSVEAPKATDLTQARTEIQAMEDAYAAAEKVKDANAVVAYYSPDAVSYGRDKQPAVGREAIKAQIAERMAKDTINNASVYKIVDLFGEGNMLVEIGSWTDVDASGAEVKKGHYMSYFEKRDGKWLCVRDMNASSEPPKVAVQ
jgi:uncharacterized protein (TIGR02246 family)